MTMLSAPHDEIYRPPATGGVRPVGGALKRALDIVVAAVALALLAPLLAIVAILIFATMGSPVLCRRPHVGFGGRTIDCHRFRTTRRGALTRLGLLLQESGIAKLPQLINVLKGEMSCVGPRPLAPDEAARFPSEAAAHHQARPGITGSWRVASCVTHANEMVMLDRAYVDGWSMRADIGILLKSVSTTGHSEN